MLQSLSGNNPEHSSYRFPIDDSSQVGEARRFALVLCSDLGFEETRAGKVAIIVNELGNNLARYAKKSQLIFRKFSTKTEIGLEILSIDSGPGMNEILALQDGYSTGTTPGTGLGAAKRQSDLFDIYSKIGEGTIILSRVYAKNLASNLPPSHELAGYEIGAINNPLRGELLSGDGWCVHENDHGLSVTLVDGLGHGPLANQAAIKALHVFAQNYNADVVDVIQKIHLDLKSTRGAAVFLLKTDANDITYTGVGNINAVLYTPLKAKALSSQNGTAGLRIGPTKALREQWHLNDYFIFHSDGLSNRWNLNNYPAVLGKHPSIIAAVLFRDFDRGTDDTTVVVVRRLK